MTWLTLQSLANWLATPDGTNSAFLALAYLGLMEVNPRIIAFLTMIIFAVLLLA
jgi:hypothetical protein